jgi:hypothetical protein
MRTATRNHLEHDDDRESSWHGSEAGSYRGQSWRERTPRRQSLEPELLVFSRNRALFNELVAKWRPDATYESMTHRVAMLPAYQEMIGMGRPALRLILERLATDPSPHWLWALRAIAREDPAQDTKEVASAVEAWLEWGEPRGYLPG